MISPFEGDFQKRERERRVKVDIIIQVTCVTESGMQITGVEESVDDFPPAAPINGEEFVRL